MTLNAARIKSPKAKFIIAGSLAAGLNWLVRFPLNIVFSYELSVILAMAIGMTLGFILYQGWVFPGSERPLWRKIIDFILVNLLGVVITTAGAILGRKLLLNMGVGPEWAAATGHALGIAAGAVGNYIGHQRITFRKAAG